MSKVDLYAEITDTIADALEAGQANAGEWQCPWVGSGQLPSNAITRREYRGVNVLSLWIRAHERGYSSARWATFKQWRSLDAMVNKGEKGTRIVFYKPLVVEDKDTGEERSIPMLRYSTVFNAEQVTGDPRTDEDALPDLPDGVSRMDKADAIIRETGAAISYGGDRAYYRPATDEVSLPIPEAFHSTEGFYSTAFHELGHWTGHKARLDRKLANRFGSAEYAAEELIAELTAAFVTGALGIESVPREDHAHYIASWIKLLRSDKRAIFTAAARAAEAADLIRDRERETDPQPQTREVVAA